MASKTLSSRSSAKCAQTRPSTKRASGVPTVGRAGLAQYAATGCLSGTFYATGDEQLARRAENCATACRRSSSPDGAVRSHARLHEGHAGAAPGGAVGQGPGLLAEVFDRWSIRRRWLRNFVQIMRSGVVGRKSLGTLPKRLIQQWLAARSDEQLFVGSIGNDPSLAEHHQDGPPQAGNSRTAGAPGVPDRPRPRFGPAADLVQQYERIKRQTVRGQQPVPNVPFQMLTSLPLTRRDWEQITRNASWQMTRMNLNTLLRTASSRIAELVGLVANRLRNPRLVPTRGVPVPVAGGVRQHRGRGSRRNP